MNTPLFTYRIVRKKGDGLFMYYLQEYKNKLYFISKYPSTFHCMSEVELKDLLKYYEEALKLPIINFEDILEFTNENVPVDNKHKNYVEELY